jgi:hypothetical protein
MTKIIIDLNQKKSKDRPDSTRLAGRLPVEPGLLGLSAIEDFFRC